MKKLVVLTSLFLSSVLSSVTNAADQSVPYPEGYRDWSHVKSMVIEPGHTLANPFQGIHHVYGNSQAIQGLKDGEYPDGAVLVFDLLNYIKQDQTIQETDRKLIGVMHKDAKRYKDTGGWGFEGFAADSTTKRLTTDGGKGCFSCHAPKADQSYVYSQYRK